MNLNLTTAQRYGLNILALLGASVALYLGRSIFVPFIIAAMLAAILYPWCRSLQARFKLPWFISCSIVLGLVVIMINVVFTMVSLSIPRLISSLPTDETKQEAMYARLRDQVESSFPLIDKNQLPHDPKNSGFYMQIKKFLTGDYITNYLIDFTKQSVNVLWQCVLVLFIVLFMLLEGQMLADKIRNIFGPGFGIRQQVTVVFKAMGEAIRSYLVWRTIVNFGLAILLGGVYAALGLKQYLLWALLTFILCYVPYLGTIAAGAPPILEAMVLENMGPAYAFGILIFYSVVVTFEGYIIVPWVMGRSMELNATTVLLACVFFELVWGTAGLFLAMPVMAAIKVVCLNVESWSAWGHLMSSENTPPPEMKTHSQIELPPIDAVSPAQSAKSALAEPKVNA